MTAVERYGVRHHAITTIKAKEAQGATAPLLKLTLDTEGLFVHLALVVVSNCVMEVDPVRQ